MALLKWCFCLTFLAGVLSDDKVENSEFVKLKTLKFLPTQKKYDQRLKELVEKLTKSNERQQVSILNEYADELLSKVNSYLIKHCLDPVELPGFDASFQWNIFTGWVLLHDGLLNGLSTFTRKGDVVFNYDYPNIKISIPLGFSRLKFNYYYVVKFLGLGPRGSADGNSDGSTFTVDLRINMVTLRAKLDGFNMDTLGSVSLKFSGNILLDWMINLILIVTMPILKPIIAMVTESYVVDAFEYILSRYNNVICTILADCNQQLATTVNQLMK